MSMDLSRLLSFATSVPPLGQLRQQMSTSGAVGRAVVLEEAKSFVLACLATQQPRPYLLVTARSDRARQFAEELSIWLGAEELVWLFPEPDGRPYERVVSDLSTTQQRLRVMTRLSEPKP